MLWLLYKALLWRAMSDDASSQAVELAGERGLGGLLAESLTLTRAAFTTPIDDDVIETLKAAGRGRTPTRLIDVRNRRLGAQWFAVTCERGLKRKARRLRESLLPPAEHMRERFPDSSRLGLPGLYWRRIRQRLERHRQFR